MQFEILKHTIIIDRDLRNDLDSLNKAEFDSQEKYGSACMSLAAKASQLHENFQNALAANVRAIASRKIQTHRDIIRLVWDLQYMNFN